MSRGMEQNNKRSRNSQRNKTVHGTEYIYGNTVRRVAPVYEPEVKQPRQLSSSTQRNSEKILQMNLGYLVFLVAALVSAALVLIGYLRLQSQITLTVKNIAELESELNRLRLSNEEEYNRAVSSVDLEQVRQIAIGELGMRYAKEGQVINVSGEGSDYVRQLSPIE